MIEIRQSKPPALLTYTPYGSILSNIGALMAKQTNAEFSTVTSKGQLVIPAKLRRKYAIRKGTRVAFVEEENRLVLQPLTPEYIDRLRGSLKKGPSALRFLLRERRRERDL